MDSADAQPSAAAGARDATVPPQLYHGDFFQLVSLASRWRDGVLFYQPPAQGGNSAIVLSASGCVQQSVGGEFDLFHCHSVGTAGVQPFLLMPVLTPTTGSPPQCPAPYPDVKQTVNALSVVVKDSKMQITVQAIDPYANSTSQATATNFQWYVEQASTSSKSSDFLLWRVYTNLAYGGRVYLAADSAGTVYAAQDVVLPGNWSGVTGLVNPQTYFCVYRKSHWDGDRSRNPHPGHHHRHHRHREDGEAPPPLAPRRVAASDQATPSAEARGGRPELSAKNDRGAGNSDHQPDVISSRLPRSRL